MRGRSRRLRALVALGTLALLAAVSASREADARSAVEQANAVLARMTHDEKIALAAAGDEGVPRLGIPGLAPSDGPNGVRLGGASVTAFPNAEVVAASWDRRLAWQFGAAVGAECAGKGFNVLLGPTVNILRTWRWGRTAETLGEDPYLAGQIAASEIQGIQSRHVIAQVKHFAANNQEVGRLGTPSVLSPAVNVIVSERALQEIYFPAFRAAVQQGGVTSVMCAYPRINGVYACQNPDILGTLKATWGFTGFVGPDAILAVRSTLAAANAGTDNFLLGVLSIPPSQALQRVSDERLDDMVRRILTAMFEVGLVDHPNTGRPDAVVSTPGHQALATEIAARGSVLLKNDGRVLPLSRDVRSIAVVGYDAGPGTQTMEGGSAAVVGGPVTTPLAGITHRAGPAVTVRYAPGTLGVVPLPVVPADVFRPGGLSGTYYASLDWSGSPVGAFVSPTLDLDAALIAGARSARWTGTLTPGVTGTYRFSLGHAGIARLLVDGQLVATGDTEIFDGAAVGLPGAPPQTFQGTVALTAGTPVPITVEYSIASSFTGSPLHLGWQPPDTTLAAAAASAASASEVAIVFVSDVTGEGMDRSSLALPGDQDALVEAVAAANRRTIVVLHTAGPVLMPWLSRVAAVIQAWYPGQQTGDAVAALLFGDIEPSGRLPMTFPASDDQGPAKLPSQYPGVDGSVHYDEGIDVGYRYYDRYGQAPLFPFGHGLSYTSFSIDRLRVERRRGGRYVVSVDVRNTGDRDGTEIVQLYVGFPPSTGEPPNQLKGFARVSLDAGQRKTVRLSLDPATFAMWSAEGGWVVQPGVYELRVGRSSRDIRQRTTVVVRNSR